MKKKVFPKLFFLKLFFTSSRPQRNLEERFKKFEKEKKRIRKEKKESKSGDKNFRTIPRENETKNNGKTKLTI